MLDVVLAAVAGLALGFTLAFAVLRRDVRVFYLEAHRRDPPGDVQSDA